MKLYLTGIKSYQLDIEIDCTAFSDRRLERTLQGIKGDHSKAARRIRTLLTRPQLLRMLSNLTLLDYNDTVTWAPFSLAFAGFLRIGEFTYRPIDLCNGTSIS